MFFLLPEKKLLDKSVKPYAKSSSNYNIKEKKRNVIYNKIISISICKCSHMTAQERIMKKSMLTPTYNG